MKQIFTLLILLVFLDGDSQAQIDQVSMGAGYSQQAYYSLETGEVETMDNNAWDIAFSAAGQQDAGIFYNESTTFMTNPMQVFLAETSNWEEPILSTSDFVEESALHNPESNWTEGAMNVIKNPNSPFDFGWGAYNPQTNTVEGDKIYVIKRRNESYFKFQVLHLIGGSYTFRWANLDGSNEQTATVDKSDANGSMIYYSLENNEEIAGPSDYDLIFKRYTTPLDAGDGTLLEYTVSGVLLAPGVEAVVARDVDPENVDETDYAGQYSSNPKIIGHDWKAFDFEQGWIVDFQRTQFVKTDDGDIYQITFFDFEGSSTGISTFEKTFITTVSSVENEVDSHTLNIYPNPSSEYFYIDSEDAQDITVQIFNTSGSLITSKRTRTNNPIHVGDFQSGMYTVLITGDAFRKTEKLIVR